MNLWLVAAMLVCFATRGRHLGWLALSVTAALAFMCPFELRRLSGIDTSLIRRRLNATHVQTAEERSRSRKALARSEVTYRHDMAGQLVNQASL